MSTDRALVIALKYILVIKQKNITPINLLLKSKFVKRKDRITNPTFKLNLARIMDKIVGACTCALGNQ